MVLNQQLINNGLLPISINIGSKYRQAFRRYDKNGDTSMLEAIILNVELESFERVKTLNRKLEKERNPAQENEG